MIRFLICMIAVAVVPACAFAQDSSAESPATAYRNVMAAQYAARQKPPPARPEEMQRVYDRYLQSIGQPIKDHSTEPSTENTVPSR
jgi:hypothetical protein